LLKTQLLKNVRPVILSLFGSLAKRYWLWSYQKTTYEQRSYVCAGCDEDSRRKTATKYLCTRASSHALVVRDGDASMIFTVPRIKINAVSQFTAVTTAVAICHMPYLSEVFFS